MKSELGLILFLWIVSNSFTWLCGIELDLKSRLVIPQIITLVLAGLMVALKLMGIE